VFHHRTQQSFYEANKFKLRKNITSSEIFNYYSAKQTSVIVSYKVLVEFYFVSDLFYSFPLYTDNLT